MAKTRYRQRQSARIYFEEHDHRDIVYNDEYVNGIYIGEQVEPAWRKYKKKTFIIGGQAHPYEYGYSVDAQNKFVSISSDWMGEAPILVGNNIMFGQFLSKNGYDFKYMDIQSTYGTGGYKFKRDSMCSVYNVGYVAYCEWTSFQYRNGESQSRAVTGGQVTLDDGDTANASIAYCGETPDGCLAWRSKVTQISQTYPYTYKYNYDLFHVTPSGFDPVYSIEWTGGNRESRPFPTNVQNQGGKYISVYPYRGTSGQGVKLLVSEEGSEDTWSEVDIIPLEPSTANSQWQSWYAFYVDGTWYFYFQKRYNNVYKWELYTSTNLSTFTRVFLPDYLDIPILSYGNGEHGQIVDSSYDSLRVILNTYDGNIPSGNVFQVSPFGYKWNGYQGDTYTLEQGDGYSRRELTRGDMCNIVMDESWDYDYLYYIDNMVFMPSNNNFALKPDWTYEYDIENIDPLQAGDYVFGGNS